MGPLQHQQHTMAADALGSSIEVQTALFAVSDASCWDVDSTEKLLSEDPPPFPDEWQFPPKDDSMSLELEVSLASETAADSLVSSTVTMPGYPALQPPPGYETPSPASGAPGPRSSGPLPRPPPLQAKPLSKEKGTRRERSSNKPPPGAVNLERSYQICQAVIQNSPNRDQLKAQLKPPPSLLASGPSSNSAAPGPKKPEVRKTEPKPAPTQYSVVTSSRGAVAGMLIYFFFLFFFSSEMGKSCS